MKISAAAVPHSPSQQHESACFPATRSATHSRYSWTAIRFITVCARTTVLNIFGNSSHA